MPEPKEGTVTVGDVSRQAIQRLELTTARLIVGIERRDLTIANMGERMRQLLSYCEGQAQHCGSAVDESAYGDIADKLRGMLDGEQ